MIPILFEHDATTFTGHGLGDLVDTISCIVSQKDTNEFELELKYPMDGRLFSEIIPNRIIYAKVNNNTNTTFTLAPQTLPYQAFRIYKCEKDLKGYITVKAQHVSYDLTNVFIMPYDSNGTSDYYGKAIGGVDSYIHSVRSLMDTISNQNYIVCGTNQFDIRTIDYSAIGLGFFDIKSPRSIRSLLFDSKDSLVATFGGICAYDSFKLAFYSYPSNILRATIDYGDTLIDFQQENNITEMITGIVPYYIGKDPRHPESDYHGADSIIYGQPIYATGTFDQQVVVAVDVTSDITSAGVNGGGYDTYYDSVSGKVIDVPRVDYFGQKWADANELGVPEVSLTVDYAHLGSNTNIQLYDLVHVRFTKLGVDTNSIVVSTEFDTLAERNIQIELGKSKAHDQYYDFGKDYRARIR